MLIALTLLTSILAPAATADDPPPALKMEAEPAFDGHFKYGEWLPIWVHLENAGSDLEAEVQIRLVSGRSTTFAAPVSLPTGSRKRIPLYVLPNNYSRQLDVQLVADGGVLLTQKVTVNPMINSTYFVGWIAPQQGAIALLQGSKLGQNDRPKEIVNLALSDLPQVSDALRSLDCLILNDIDTSSLTPGQKTVLENWVSQGGRLVIGGGAGARRTAAGLPESLLPVQPRDTVEIDTLPGLADFAGAGAIRVPGPFLVTSGLPDQGQALAVQDDLPLVYERSVGSGTVNFVALDLTAAPFDAWSGTTAFWQKLLSSGADYPNWLPRDISARQMKAGPMSYALSNLPSLDLPSVRGLSILLAVYILLVGPINYLVLRWRKRLHLAWFSVPLLTIVFSAGAFSLGYALRGTDLYLNKIAIVQLESSGTASLTSYVGIFSPSQQSYEIEVKGDGLLAPLNPDHDPWGAGRISMAGDVAFVQGNPGRVRGLSVNQWSMQTFMTESTWPDMGQIAGDLWLEGHRLVGTVRNETSQTLTDVVVILGQDFVRLGDLAPGAETSVTLDLAARVQQPFGPPVSYRLFEQRPGNQPNLGAREEELKRTVVNSLFGEGGQRGWDGVNAAGGLVLLGWLDQSPPEVYVAEQTPVQQTTALVYTRLPYRFAGEEPISLPPGLVPGVMIETPLEGGQCGPGPTSLWLGRGDAVFEFRLPEAVGAVQAESLTLQIYSDGGGQLPEISVYHWDSQEWLVLDKPIMGINAIPNPTSLIGDNRVRVRFSTSGNQPAGCLHVSLGLEAE